MNEGGSQVPDPRTQRRVISYNYLESLSKERRTCGFNPLKKLSIKSPLVRRVSKPNLKVGEIFWDHSFSRLKL